MGAHFKLDLLGGFQLSGNTQPVRGLKSLRVQSLLAYLVLHHQLPQPRQQLAFALWPDTPEEQARTNLRKAILFLRRALPVSEILTCSEGSLQWNPKIPFAVDVIKFQAAVEAGAFEQAIALYAGDLLPNCYDEWIVEDRERLKQMYVAALRTLAQQKEAAGDYAAALALLQRLLQTDPLREETHRSVMRIHALNGDHAAMLHAYQNCATLLKQELGVEPSLATRQLHDRLFNYSASQATPATRFSAMPLVGRQDERAQLLKVWHDAAQGKPQMALITGESGIGKTRLAEELLVWANRRGISFASAQCFEMEETLAYAPVKTWLRDRPLADLEPVWRIEVARLLPELIDSGAEQTAPGPIAESWQRQRFHQALLRAVLGQDLASTIPLLLLIEDLQWCDPATLHWLHDVLHFNSRARLLVLGTLREDTVKSDSRQSVLFAALRRQNLLTEIKLGPLSPDETTQLGEQAVGNALDAETSRSLYAETEGNPLFIIEYARTGLATPEEGDTSRSGYVLPPRVQAVVSARLRQLSPSARKAMDVMATIGRDFTYSVLAKASDENEDTLIQALDELWRRQVVRERGKEGYDFSHDKLRQVAYMNLSSARRQWLHKRVAQALIDLSVGSLEAPSAEIAWHYEQAGDDPAAVRYLLLASESALKIGAFSDAIAHLTRALGLTPETDQLGRYTVMLARERVYHLQGTRDLQARDLGELEELAAKLDDGSPEGAFRQAKMAIEKGTYLCETSDLTGALAEVERALTWLELLKKSGISGPGTAVPTDSANALAQVEFGAYDLWGTCLNYQGDFRAAIVHEEKALAVASEAGLRREQASALSGLAYATFNIQEGKEYLKAALPIYREVRDKPGECTGLERLGYLHVWTGDYDDALECYEQSLELARQIGFKSGEGTALFRLGHLFNQVGHYAKGRRYLEQALCIARGHHDRRRVAYLLFNVSGSELGLGRRKVAKEHAEEALAIVQEIGDGNGEINAWHALGSAHAALNERDEAVAAFQHALDLVQASDDLGAVIYFRARLAGALLDDGQLCQALAHVEEILAFQQKGGDVQGTDEGPIPIYMECYRVLQAHQDPRARDLLEQAQGVFQSQVSRMKKETLRQPFIKKRYPKIGNW